MELVSLGSSSKGNCHILCSNGIGIMLDCGINFNGLNSFLRDYNVKYILLSHCHQDHIFGLLNEQLSDLQFKIIGNDETIEKIKKTKYFNKIIVEENNKYELDDYFDITTLHVPHDARNFGFIIFDKKKNVRTLYLTDIGYIDNITVKNIDNFIIECNYDEDDISKDELEDYKNKRSHGLYGHLSLQGCANFIKRSININTRNIILVHISSQNKDYKKMENKLKKELKDYKMLNIKAINNRITKNNYENTTLINENEYDDIVINDVEFI